MPRLIGYLAIVLATGWLLRQLPIFGGLFRGFLGFYLTLLIVGALVTWGGERWRRRQKLERELNTLGQVETDYNQGKRGALLLANGRLREAVPPLERAMAGEPQSAEWPYRLAQAQLRLGQPERALACLERVAALDEDYGYGSVPLARAEALERLGRHQEALKTLEDYERSHGPTPESACRAARLLKSLGQTQAAQRRFKEVPQLYQRLPAFQKAQQRPWLARAWAASLF